MSVDYSALRRESDAGPDGVEPGRARAAVRDLTAPLLVHPAGGDGVDLPNVVGLGQVAATVRRLAGLGMAGVKGWAYGTRRDATASAATATGNLMCQAVTEIKAAAPEMVVTTEVCGCSWTCHGECAILDGRGRIDTAATFDLMGAM